MPEKTDQNVPFYYSPLFLMILCIVGPILLFVPTIISFILLYRRSSRYITIPNNNLIYDAALTERENLLKLKREELDGMYKDLENEKDRLRKELENEQYRLKKENENYKQSLSYLQASILEAKKTLENLQSDTNLKLSLPETNSAVFDNIPASGIKTKLALLVEEEKKLVKDEKATKFIQAAYNMNDAAKKKQRSQILRGFNGEVDNIIQNVTVNNIDSQKSKIMRAFSAYNNLFVKDGVELTMKLLESKLKRADYFYEYQLKLAREKELLQAQKEQIKEEEKVRREVEAAKKKIEHDETQFNNEINRLMKYMQKSSMDEEKQLYMDKIKELESKLEALSKEKENVLQREANAKAGFVYIISNIGSFGENIFKIGMTRRLEPMDRIKELSSASVPFEFDVHAMIFADDAPALESLLHQHFRNKEVNKVNHRKEFFKVDLKEIEKLVKEKYNDTVNFIEIPQATEFRESIKLAEQEHSEEEQVFA